MYIDLSVHIDDQTPVYPGDPQTKIAPNAEVETDGYCAHYISIGTHAGTHIDAPAHMLAGGKTLDQISLEQCTGNGRLIEIAGDDFGVVRSAGIQAGDIVLFRTGMSRKYHEKIYFETYPLMSEEVAEYLVAAKVKMVGVDACSVDNQDGFPIHKALLAAGVLIVENLTNLDQLVGKAFKVYALPLNVALDGAPARVIAELV